jgi:hypothetical protein
VRQLGPLVRRTGIGWPRWSRDGIRIGYDGGGSVSVVKVATLEPGSPRAWCPDRSDNDTLVMGW